ncbi:MAG: hypothetical protein HC802_02920 [Caldilineaceae bacterium]|nr:hypothetical protein [Caldilineaceae bacterium]
MTGVYELDREAMPAVGRPHHFGLSPSVLVTLGGEAEARLEATSTRERPMSGTITVEPPAGWAVEQGEFPIQELNAEHPFAEQIHLRQEGDRPSAATGFVRLDGDLFDQEQPFTVIRLGDAAAPVRVTERREADQPLWEIDNGRCLWTIAPDYHAGVIGWRDGDRSVNHLLTTFPKPGELSWMSPLLGGVRPSIMLSADGEDFPGKLHNETFTVSQIETADERGLLWSGLQLETAITREGLEGLRVELAYSTVGDSNVLKVVFRLINDDDAYRRVEPRLLTFLQVDGRADNGVLYGDTLQRKRTSHMAWPKVGAWGAVENPDTGRTVALVAASGRRDIILLDWGMAGGHLLLREHPLLAPKSSHDIVAYLILADSVGEARQYEMLAQPSTMKA